MISHDQLAFHGEAQRTRDLGVLNKVPVVCEWGGGEIKDKPSKAEYNHINVLISLIVNTIKHYKCTANYHNRDSPQQLIQVLYMLVSLKSAFTYFTCNTTEAIMPITLYDCSNHIEHGVVTHL